MKNLRILLLLLGIFSITYQKTLPIFSEGTEVVIESENIGDAEENGTPKNPTLLQVSARPWLYLLSERKGKTIKSFKQIPDDVFADIQTKGFDYLWVMGVWSIGQEGIKHDRTTQSLVDGYKKILPDYKEADAIGCPYAITQYTCNPELCPGGDDDLTWLRNKLKSYNIKLMLDFVPNHSAHDSPWVKSNPTYYIRKPSGDAADSSRYFSDGIAFGNMQYSSAWTDVAQLNYWDSGLRTHMTNQLLKIAKYADGIRCDMAYIILNDYFGTTWSKELKAYSYSKPSKEFWTSAISSVKSKYPNTIFLAEVYGDYYTTLIDTGFDYTYDKTLLDRFHSEHLDNIRDWITHTKSQKQHMCRFLENHDDNRAVEHFGNSVTKANAAALATYTLPGLRFFFQDQWLGFQNKLDVHLRRAKSESQKSEAVNLYNKLFPIITDPTIKNGEWTYLTVSGNDAWRLMAWKWKNSSTSKKMLIVCNFSNTKAGGSVVVSDVSGSGNITIKELLSGTSYTRSASEMKSSGLNVVVDAWSAQYFSYS
jgi:glycosidase